MSKWHNAENMPGPRAWVLVRTWELEAAVDTVAAATVRIIAIISICAHYYSDHLSHTDAPSSWGGEDFRLLAPHLHKLEITSLFPSFPLIWCPRSYFMGLVSSEGTQVSRGRRSQLVAQEWNGWALLSECLHSTSFSLLSHTGHRSSWTGLVSSTKLSSHWSPILCLQQVWYWRGKVKFYITSCSFCLCNSVCSLQSLNHVGHIVSESGDL